MCLEECIKKYVFSTPLKINWLGKKSLVCLVFFLFVSCDGFILLVDLRRIWLKTLKKTIELIALLTQFNFACYTHTFCAHAHSNIRFQIFGTVITKLC